VAKTYGKVGQMRTLSVRPPSIVLLQRQGTMHKPCVYWLAIV